MQIPNNLHFTKHARIMLRQRGIPMYVAYLAIKYGDCRLSNNTSHFKRNIPNSQYRSEHDLTNNSISKARKEGVEIPTFFIGIRVILSVDNFIITVIDKNSPSK